MNTATAPSSPPATVSLNPGFWARRNALDWLFALVLLAGTAFAWHKYGYAMDEYETGILLLTTPGLIALGWFWRPMQKLMLAVGGLSLLAIWLYQGPDGAAHIDRAETVFGLKFLLSSQSAILWMGVLCFVATVFYWIALFAKSEQSTFGRIATGMVWLAVTLALVGTMVRWYEATCSARTSATSR